MDEDTKKKNFLDLLFQKYLMIASTSSIIAFTYFIGVIIAIFAKQIQFDSFLNTSILFLFSLIVLGLCAIFFFDALFHLKNIPQIIKNL